MTARVSASSSVTTHSLTCCASPIFVHHTEGKRKACSDLLKLLLRDIPILVEIIVLKDRLKKKKKNFFHLLKRNQSSLTPGHIPALCCPSHYRLPRYSKPVNINCAVHTASALCRGWVSSPSTLPSLQSLSLSLGSSEPSLVGSAPSLGSCAPHCSASVLKYKDCLRQMELTPHELSGPSSARFPIIY